MIAKSKLAQLLCGLLVSSLVSIEAIPRSSRMRRYMFTVTMTARYIDGK